MQKLTVTRDFINTPALEAELRGVLGEQYVGLSTYSGNVVIHLLDDTSMEQVQQAEQLVKDHDPSVLTPKQQEEQTRQQRLEDFRAADALDLSAYDGATADVQTLAQKIAWLELEIRELRGL